MNANNVASLAGTTIALLGALIAFSTLVRSKLHSKDISIEFQRELTADLDDPTKSLDLSNETPPSQSEENELPRLEKLPSDVQEWVVKTSKIRSRDTVELARLRRLLKQQQHDVDERRYRLLRAYATQGLTQSKISFNTSLSAAALGFSVILVGVVLSLFGGRIEQAIVPVISGTVIDAVSLLFFVQDRRHQKTMFDFFERLREDRKLDEALALLNNTPDEQIPSRVQAAMVLHFAEVPDALHVLGIADGHPFVDAQKANPAENR
jgi:hypothetical protein